VKVLRFYFFSRWRPPPSWIVEFAILYWLSLSGGPRCIILPNFFKIGRSVAEILRFFKFSKWPLLPSWIFEIAKFYWLLGWRGSRHISMPNFVKIGQSVAKILLFFDFSRWQPQPSWIVEFAKFYWLMVFGGRRRITTEFHQNWSFRCEDIAIYQIFKTAATTILDFWNREIVLVIRVQRVETHLRAKFCQNRSISCEYIKIFFDFSRLRIPPSLIVKFAKFYWLSVSGGPRRITVPNFVKIGRSVAKILRFFKFSKWPPPPSWIIEIAKILLAIWV